MVSVSSKLPQFVTDFLLCLASPIETLVGVTEPSASL